MTKTEHYQLNQWDAADPVRREDFNADNAAVDAALNAIQSAAEEELASLTAELGNGGKNCRITWGSYTGSGKYGSGNPNVLTFDFTPVVVWVGSVSGARYVGWPSTFLRGCTLSCAEYGSGELTVQWTDKGLSWYTTANNADFPGYYQNNIGGWVYYYYAIGY